MGGGTGCYFLRDFRDAVLGGAGLGSGEVDVEVDYPGGLEAVEDGYAGDDWKGTRVLGEVPEELGDGEEDCGVVLFDCFVLVDAEDALGDLAMCE